MGRPRHERPPAKHLFWMDHAVGEVTARRAMHRCEMVGGEHGRFNDQLVKTRIDSFNAIDNALGHLVAELAPFLLR